MKTPEQFAKEIGFEPNHRVTMAITQAMQQAREQALEEAALLVRDTAVKGQCPCALRNVEQRNDFIAGIRDLKNKGA